MLLLSICVLFLEGAVRVIKPQVTYSQAVRLSIDCYAKDPFIPFTLGKNYRCKMVHPSGEFDTAAQLNSLGYRGEEFSVEKKQGTTRILTLGDSMTFGWGVGDQDTYPALLEESLRKSGHANVEVINGGYVGGLSPDTFYVYLKNQGMKLKPDMILLNLFVFNDITDIAESVWEKVDSGGLPEKIDSCCHMVDGRIFRNKVIDFKYRYPVLRESNLYILLSDVLERQFQILKRPEQLSTKGEKMMGCVLNPNCIHLFYPEEQKMHMVIEAMKKLADESDAKFLVVLFPVDVQLYPESVEKYSRFGMKWYPPKGDENFLNKRIFSTLSQRSILVLDLFSDFDKNRSLGYPFFPIDAHFNPIGTGITAESVSRYLQQNILLE